MLKKILLAGCLLGLTTVAQAEIRPIIEVGIESGGDFLVKTTAEDMNAGGGFYLGAGVDLVTGDSDDVFYRIMVGYLFDTIDFIGGDASTNAVPIHLGVFKRFDRHEGGIGLAYYMGPTYEVCMSWCSTYDFDNAIGFYAQYNYHFGNGAYLGGKYTSVEYSGAAGLGTIDASSLGIYLGASF